MPVILIITQARNRTAMITNRKPLATFLSEVGLGQWYPTVCERNTALMSGRLHGDSPGWLAALDKLPDAVPSAVDFDRDRIRMGVARDMNAPHRQQLRRSLQALCPWRKGPFHLFGEFIDSEWRSDWKWRRVVDAIGDLRGQRILDVGSGNGYYALRMVGAGARGVVGLEPVVLYTLQFQAIVRYHAVPAWILPFRLEEMPSSAHFDTLFSMGVLTHSRAPMDHLRLLRKPLRAGGLLVLETLMVPGPRDHVLEPAKTYARMRNVWYLPSPATLQDWLSKAGFIEIRFVREDLTRTTEQRRTAWMPFQSLADSLDPEDSRRTIEGYPAPRRALLTALNPG